jgi:hypothetical protein
MYVYHNPEARSDPYILIYSLSLHCSNSSNSMRLFRKEVMFQLFHILIHIYFYSTAPPFTDRNNIVVYGLLLLPLLYMRTHVQ